MENNQSLYEEAKKYIPGGVNSPVRAFKGVGGTPRFILKGKGSRIWDVEEKSTLTMCFPGGPLFLVIPTKRW